MGITPEINGNVISLTIPEITEELRNQLLKQIKQLREQAKISIFNICEDIKNKLKSLDKEGISEETIKKAINYLQKFQDNYLKKVESIFTAKEKEIL